MLLINVLVGLTIFLFGMNQLEAGIRLLGYHAFRNWLLRSTGSAVGSATCGMLITAILQSSSMVSLLVLAFASAGMLPLFNAIGVILGANLGTTITGWLVTLIGFKLSLSALAVPLIGIGCAGQLLPEAYRHWQGLGRLLFGFGLLLFGLDLMKETVAAVPAGFDISALQGHGLWLYALVGLLLSAIIQSSSATMLLTLSSLYSGLIGLQDAAAIMIGANLGTTSTVILAGLYGSVIKKQLALAHFLFNIVASFFAFLVLLPLLQLFATWMTDIDPLYTLVGFYTLVNLVGLMLFLPFLNAYSQWIGGRFLQEEPDNPLLAVPVAVPEAALLALDMAYQRILLDSIALNLLNFKIKPGLLGVSPELKAEVVERSQQVMTFEQRYEALKQAEADALDYANLLQGQSLTESQSATLTRLLSDIRNVVYCSKTLKDIRQNLAMLRHSDRESVKDLYEFYTRFQKTFYNRLLDLVLLPHEENWRKEQGALLSSELDEYLRESNSRIQVLLHERALGGADLSSLLNVNREIHHALINLLNLVR